MARNIKQSTQGLSTTATSDCPIGRYTSLEIKLAKLKQPALIQALEKVGHCSCFQFISLNDFVENGRVNPHDFTEASYPMDMSAIYDAYELYDLDVCESADGNPDFLPTLSGYIAWLVVCKLWRLCDSATNSARPVYTPATVMEITNICLLAVHAERLLHSEDRAIATGLLLGLFGRKVGKQAERLCALNWEKAEESFYDRYSSDQIFHSSSHEAAMGLCESGVSPFNVFDCYKRLQAFEEQI